MKHFRMLRWQNDKKKSLLAWLLACVLVAGFSLLSLSLNYSPDTLAEQTRLLPPDKIATKFTNAANYRSALALDKSTSGFSFVYSFSLLRFDFKQNPHTWSVAADHLGRSPPAAALS